MSITTISPAELHALAASGPLDLIDVRTPAEFAGGQAQGARNLPLDRLAADALGRTGGPLYVICQSGTRSRKACAQLVSAGVTDVVDVLGGTTAWKAAGLPMVGSGVRVFSVERQVRCIIGGGVLVGAVLALTVHPYYAGISAFFGAGLFLAGLTDFCGLALLVAVLPWNRSGPVGGACCIPAARTP